MAWVGSGRGAWSGHDDSSALLALEHAAKGADARAWPWPFRATQWFGLAAHEGGATLTVKLALVNTGDAPFPFGLGLHPFFPRTAATELDFDVDGVWENDADAVADPSRRHPAGVAA